MRVAWVHPSWRDLVIEHLSADDEARGRYLRCSSIHGVLLALSTQGGAAGTRQLPLLRDDDDWDAVGDRVHALAPALEPAELIGLLDAIAATQHALQGARAQVEADALARTALTRIASGWTGRDTPISPPELAAWLELAGRLSPRPSPPPLGLTWVELLPVRAPDLSDHRGVERFADWLALAEALYRFDRDVLAGLGVDAWPPQPVLDFIDELGALDIPGGQTTLAASAARALQHIGRLFPSLSVHTLAWRRAWARVDHDDPSPQPFTVPADLGAGLSGRLDVDRVLRDL